jgi:uncharacterized protein HemX
MGAQPTEPNGDHCRMLLFKVSQETASAVIAAAVIVLAFLALAIVGWIFWRAARRDREAGR